MGNRIAPGWIVVAGAAPLSVTLAWNPSTDPTVVGYRVYYGNSGGNYTQSIDAGNATTATVSNLTAGAVYFFVVTAYNSAGFKGEALAWLASFYNFRAAKCGREFPGGNCRSQPKRRSPFRVAFN